MAWPDQLIHFVDFEGSTVSGILEYGVVSLRGGEIVAARGRVCRPIGRVRAEDIAVHGLDEAATAGAAPFAEDFEVFAAFREGGPLAAHFANAENTLIKSAWPYARATRDFARDDGATTAEWGPWIDTGRLYPQARGAGAPVKLGELVATEGLQERLDALAAEICPEGRRHYHAALYDALAGALLLARLAETPGWGDKSLRWLIEHSTLDAGRREELRQGELF
jgi:DNA polymerase III, epsilon subunit and related 3''-5'' exonucleases